MTYQQSGEEFLKRFGGLGVEGSRDEYYKKRFGHTLMLPKCRGGVEYDEDGRLVNVDSIPIFVPRSGGIRKDDCGRIWVTICDDENRTDRMSIEDARYQVRKMMGLDPKDQKDQPKGYQMPKIENPQN